MSLNYVVCQERRHVPGFWMLGRRIVGVRGSVNWGTGGWMTSMEKRKAAVRKLFQGQNIVQDRPHG